MRYSVKVLLLLPVVVACSLPFVTRVFYLATYPRLESATSGKPTEFKEPYIYQECIHDPNWGGVRIVVVRKITTKELWAGDQEPRWFKHEYGGPVYVNNQLVVPNDSIQVYYSTDDGAPQRLALKHEDLVLRDPWWIDGRELWERCFARSE